MSLAQYFKTEKRRDLTACCPCGSRSSDAKETTFVTFVDDAPDWLRDAVRVAHRGMLPSDWIFEECRAVCGAIDDGVLNVEKNEAGDIDFSTYVDDRVDVYTKERFQWAADMCLTELFAEAEEQAEELGFEGGVRTEARLGLIQYCAIEIVVQTMLESLRARDVPGEGEETKVVTEEALHEELSAEKRT